MLIAYILFCFIALFMTYRRHRREKRIRQLEDRWEEYYANQYRQNGSYNQGLRDSGTAGSGFEISQVHTRPVRRF